MALYKYLASSPGEAPREVLIEADTEKESLDKLRRRGMIPVRSFGEAGEKRGGGFSAEISADGLENSVICNNLRNPAAPLEFVEEEEF